MSMFLNLFFTNKHFVRWTQAKRNSLQVYIEGVTKYSCLIFGKFMHSETRSQESCAVMDCPMTGLTVVFTYSGVVCFYKLPSNKDVCLYSVLIAGEQFTLHGAWTWIWALTSWIVKYPQEIHWLTSVHYANFERYLQDLRDVCYFCDCGQIKARLVIPWY